MVRDALADLARARSLDRPDGLGPQFDVSEPRPLPPTADLKTWLRAQLVASAKLDVQDVPQADDLDRVANVVEARAHGRMFDDVTPRQWAYYRRAAKILGLIDEITDEPTAAGLRIASVHGSERTAALAEQFRRSRCGDAWLGWSKARSFDALEPTSAIRFLRECVPTMSEATRKRRAATLEKWRAELSTTAAGDREKK